jgi:hypothetical protein
MLNCIFLLAEIEKHYKKYIFTAAEKVYICLQQRESERE